MMLQGRPKFINIAGSRRTSPSERGTLVVATSYQVSPRRDFPEVDRPGFGSQGAGSLDDPLRITRRTVVSAVGLGLAPRTFEDAYADARRDFRESSNHSC